MLSFRPRPRPLLEEKESRSSSLISTSNSMAEWSHTHKHQVLQDRSVILDYLHDSEALLSSSKDVISVRQIPKGIDDGDADDCWLVVERVKGLSILEATTRVRIKRTPDGVNIHRRNSHGIELWSVWTVLSNRKESSPKTIATEFVMAKAPWYIMPIVKSRLSQSFTSDPLQDRIEASS